jgi:hypothetical protein
VLAYLYDMEEAKFLSIEEAYKNKDETTNLSWAFCPLTYSIFIKHNNLIQQWTLKDKPIESNGKPNILSKINRMKLSNT